ncbi:MAG: glycoside hydrolase family 3 C-terminal domain-containing protein [Rikenellaceae bacterium]
MKKLTLSILTLMCSVTLFARTEAETDKKVAEIMPQLTLDEKLSLLHGVGKTQNVFGDKDARAHGVTGIERLGIPDMYMGHGITAAHVGSATNIHATYVGAPVGAGCSWDKELYARMGGLIALELRALGQDLTLGPTFNIIRNPLGGRTWESLSEDPYLSARMAAGVTLATQEQGIICGPKHFMGNNQEHNRFDINNVIDERTLREMYLPAFEAAVVEGGALNMMGSYNMINGEFMCQNSYVLTDILRDEWGFRGFVLSDFNRGVRSTVKAATAGLNVEMSTKKFYGERMKAEIEKGNLSMDVVDELVREYLWTLYYMDIDTRPRKSGAEVHTKEAIALARECAQGALVLLENNGILPLDASKAQSIAMIGPNAKRPTVGNKTSQYFYYMLGGGSGRACYFDDAIYEPFAAVKDAANSSAKITYAQGTLGANNYVVMKTNRKPIADIDNVKANLLSEAVETAKAADVVVLVLGFTGDNESEGKDRLSEKLPEDQVKLVESVCAVNKNVIAYVVGGSFIDMSAWKDLPQALVYVPFCGEQVGGAMADVLYGKISPSGKLATTWPKSITDFPKGSIFTDKGYSVSGKSNEYKEGVFVGYRWFDKQKLEVAYPFGYGKSYTTFEYSDIKVKGKGTKLTVTAKIKNTGNFDAKEVAQLYISDVKSSVERPLKELKGFTKVDIKKGETVTVSFELDDRSFAFYDVKAKGWKVEAGDFDILVGGSSDSLPLKATVKMK